MVGRIVGVISFMREEIEAGDYRRTARNALVGVRHISGGRAENVRAEASGSLVIAMRPCSPVEK